MEFRTGTAGWNIPKSEAHLFSRSGSHLERYASALSAVEINSSFYRDHLRKTYARWRDSVPAHFRFSVKLHQRFTHEQRLNADAADLAEVLDGVRQLGTKLGAVLVQLPPSLELDPPLAARFFRRLRARYAGPLACEPRHASWAAREGRALFRDFAVTKVRADPTPCPAETPADWENGFSYFRLHGSPEVYKSEYSLAFLASLAAVIRKIRHPAWCIFDNTTFGHAWHNAAELARLLAADGEGLKLAY